MENIQNEIWKSVKDYEGLYEVSNLGRIKSLDKEVSCGFNGNYKRIIKGKILNPSYDNDSYLHIGLTKDYITKNYFIHRLVAIAFIENLENKPQVNHIDGNKSNNRLKNLEWNTLSENRVHAYNTGLQKGACGEKQPISKLNDKKVLEIRKIGKSKTLLEISEMYNVNFRTISNVLLRKTWKHI